MDLYENNTVMEKRNLGRANSLGRAKAILKKLEPAERKVVKCLAREPLHIDAISRISGLGVQEASSVLLMLELKGIVEQEPGKIFRIKPDLL